MLQRFQRFVLELNDFAVSHINDVMVMPVAVLGGLEAGTTVSKIVALKDLRFFKKTNRPVHSRHADAIIDLDGALMKFFGIRMIIGSRKYLGNNAPLAGHLKTSVLAELFLLRTEGPTQEDVSSTCEIARREHEEALQTNQYWLERLRQSAFAQRVDGSKAEKLELWEAERQQVLREMSPAGVTQVLQALLSHSNTNYSIVTLLPSSLPTCGALASAVHENLIRCAAPSW